VIIDYDPPYSSGATKENVIATLTTELPISGASLIANEWTSSGTLPATIFTKTFTANNTGFTLDIDYTDGSTGSITSIVNWIDKVPPVISGINVTLVTTGSPSAIITVTATDAASPNGILSGGLTYMFSRQTGFSSDNTITYTGTQDWV
jgi:hypothetical protein